jgi:hypothetical protein
VRILPMLNNCILRRAETHRGASDKGRNLSISCIRLENSGLENELRIVLAINYPLFGVIRMSSRNSSFRQGWLTRKNVEPDYLALTWRSKNIYEKLKHQMDR